MNQLISMRRDHNASRECIYRNEIWKKFTRGSTCRDTRIFDGTTAAPGLCNPNSLYAATHVASLVLDFYCKEILLTVIHLRARD